MPGKSSEKKRYEVKDITLAEPSHHLKDRKSIEKTIIVLHWERWTAARRDIRTCQRGSVEFERAVEIDYIESNWFKQRINAGCRIR